MLGNPCAYSKDIRIDLPQEGDDDLWYYAQIRFYVPSAIANRWFSVYNYGSTLCSYQNWFVDYGAPPSGHFWLAGGWHRILFDFRPHQNSGFLNFSIRTEDSEHAYAWLDRFHLDTPNYTDNGVTYTIKTRTYLPEDTYFLIGYADDYIQDVYSGNDLKWSDWQWQLDPQNIIWAWGDGFSYPLGEYDSNAWHDMSFTYGEIWQGGVLDFQYASWSQQRNRFGPSKFYANANLSRNKYSRFPWKVDPIPYCDANEGQLFGGSKYMDATRPEMSNRLFETRLRINAVNDYPDLNVTAEVGLGVMNVTWALGPGTLADDIGIPLNLTVINVHSGYPYNETISSWRLLLYNATLDIHSFSALDITGVEFRGEGESIVNQGWTVGVDYIGTVMMFVSSTLEQPVGALVGLGIKGIAASAKYTQGQQLPPYTKTVEQTSHYQLWYNNLDDLQYLGVAYYRDLPGPYPFMTANDIVFFKLAPDAGRRCGLTMVKLTGTLVLTGGWYAVVFPLADIEMTLAIPWFIRG